MILIVAVVGIVGDGSIVSALTVITASLSIISSSSSFAMFILIDFESTVIGSGTAQLLSDTAFIDFAFLKVRFDVTYCAFSLTTNSSGSNLSTTLTDIFTVR